MAAARLLLLLVDLWPCFVLWFVSDAVGVAVSLQEAEEVVVVVGAVVELAIGQADRLQGLSPLQSEEEGHQEQRHRLCFGAAG